MEPLVFRDIGEVVPLIENFEEELMRIHQEWIALPLHAASKRVRDVIGESEILGLPLATTEE